MALQAGSELPPRQQRRPSPTETLRPNAALGTAAKGGTGSRLIYRTTEKNKLNKNPHISVCR